MSALVIENGRVIDPAQKIDAKLTVVIDDEGNIADLTSKRVRLPNADVVDARGAIVCPGFIDLHVHLRDPGHEYKEDIDSGTKAAARGGFTLVCCMPNTEPVNDNAAVTDYIVKRAAAVGSVTVLPIGAISKGQKGEQLADIGEMAAAGAIAISDDGRWVQNSSLMRRAFEYAKGFRLPIITHAEDLSLRGRGVMNEGSVSSELGLEGMSPAAEEIAIARDIQLAELTGGHLHVAHVSTAKAVELIRHAKRKGIRVTTEVTPHHFTLTDEVVRGYDPNTKMNPPLRTEVDRRAMIAGLRDGTIDCIATDHAPHAIVDKEVGFDQAAFGIVGLETALSLGLKLVEERQLTLKELIALLTIKPANVFQLKGKGSLKKGTDADITIFDPKKAVTITAKDFLSKSRNTPFEGWKLKGCVTSTIVKGSIVYP
ncbi:MAG: dihydroorotase [Deltaproteobacteria bacterium]|nr:dihydroorotase [Deltaproteobacteria bacterium]